MTVVENEDGVSPATAQQLKIIAGSMGAGLALIAGLVCWSHAHAAGKVPTPADVRLINFLTTVMMVVALAAIVASEILWRSMLRKSAGPLDSRVSPAFILRLACREAASLGGMTAAYLAAANGVLRVYPAYWVNLAPFALFLGFLAAHWPSVEKLEADAREVIANNPSFLKK